MKTIFIIIAIIIITIALKLIPKRKVKDSNNQYSDDEHDFFRGRKF